MFSFFLIFNCISILLFFFNLLIDCLPGYYGNKCGKACSGQCLNNTICDYIDGRCSDGCQPGYIGKLCNTCKIFMSSFISVLDNSFVNDYLLNTYNFSKFTACTNGFYGQNCSRVCSSNCKNCRHSDGTCSCHAGWMGSNCSIGISKTSQ